MKPHQQTEWYAILSDDEKLKVDEYTDKWPSSKRADKNKPYNSFIWAFTPDGYMYWFNEVHRISLIINAKKHFEKLNTKDSSLETLFEVNNTNYIKFLESRIDQLQDQLNSLKVSINSNNLYEKINDRNPDVTGCYITNLGSKFYSKLTERWDTMREGNVDWWFKKLN